MTPFSDQLRLIRDGHLDKELTIKLADCIHAVQDTAGTATLTLKLTIKPHEVNLDWVVIKDEVTVKLPQGDTTCSLQTTPDGALYDAAFTSTAKDTDTKVTIIQPDGVEIDRLTGEVQKEGDGAEA